MDTATAPRRRRPGRPRKIRANRRLRNVTVCLTEQDAQEIARRAESEGLSVSTWLRLLAVDKIKN